MMNLDNILKNRDITLPTKVHLFKAMVFPIVMYGCESWTIKKPYDPAIPLLGIHTEETRIERDTCTPMFIAASGSFQMSQLFASGGQSIGVSASTSVLPMNTQD